MRHLRARCISGRAGVTLRAARTRPGDSSESTVHRCPAPSPGAIQSPRSPDLRPHQLVPARCRPTRERPRFRGSAGTTPTPSIAAPGSGVSRCTGAGIVHGLRDRVGSGIHREGRRAGDRLLVGSVRSIRCQSRHRDSRGDDRDRRHLVRLRSLGLQRAPRELAEPARLAVRATAHGAPRLVDRRLGCGIRHDRSVDHGAGRYIGGTPPGLRAGSSVVRRRTDECRGRGRDAVCRRPVPPPEDRRRPKSHATAAHRRRAASVGRPQPSEVVSIDRGRRRRGCRR